MGAQINIPDPVPLPRCLNSVALPARPQPRVGFEMSDRFLRLALRYVQLRDELWQLDSDPFACAIERAELRHHIHRVRARFACVPLLLR